MTDFAVSATLNGTPIRGIPSGGNIEPFSGYTVGEATNFECPASLGADGGDSLVVLEGEFAGNYVVREVSLDDSRRFALLRLEKQ